MSETYQKINPPIYEGKASRLWEVKDYPNRLIIERKDDITKLDGEVRDHIEGKGSYTNRISNLLFRYIDEETRSVTTHFVEELTPNETLIVRAEPLKLEVIVRNVAAGSLCRNLPFETGTVLKQPIVEFDYKSDEYKDPLANDDQLIALGIVDDAFELDRIREIASEINDALKELFDEAGITLVDFKIEIGRDEDGDLILIDELSPDTMRLWDQKTGASLDKDIFRKGGSNDATSAAYNEIFERLSEQFDN